MLASITGLFAEPWALTLLKVIAVFAVVLPMVAYAVVAERRISAWIQDRVGPNRVGIPFTNIRLLGLGQPLADGIKSLVKEDLTPVHVRKAFYWMAPALVLVPSFVVLAVVPFGSMLGAQKMVIADLDVGILFTFGIVSLGVYGIVLAGYASNSKYPFLGGIRSSAQMISYEIAMGMAVVPVFMLAADPAWQKGLSESWSAYLDGAGLLNLSSVIAYQSDSLFRWLVFKQPLAFAIFLVAIFAETNRLPFDLPESETELVAGYNTEYSSVRFALFPQAEYINMTTMAAVATDLYLGGWHGPFLPPEYGWVWFLLKVGVILFAYIWVRWTVPRYRYDQLMRFGWKWLFPASVINLIVTAALVLYFNA